MSLTDIDRSLLDRCMKNDGGAWREFVDRFVGLFVQVIRHTAHARSVNLSASDIDDLCAEVFLAILADQHAVLKRFRGESSLATYLTVIARRLVVREMVRRRMSEVLATPHLTETITDTVVPAESREISRIDNEEMVQQMLDGLSPHDASVIRQFHLEGKTYREIGEGLGVPENSIGPTLTRAREKLRKGLSASLG